MKKYRLVKFLQLGMLLCAGQAFAYDATEADFQNAVGEIFGYGSYAYYDHQGTDGELGFRTKNWGTNGNLADSSKDHWVNGTELVDELSGLMPSTYYELYVVAGGKVNTGANECWGVRVGLESGNYMLETVDIGDDSSVTRYNLGEYYNEDMGVYPYREVQGDINAACMYVAYVGIVESDSNGDLTVYVNDGEFTLNGVQGIRTWYDGLMLTAVRKPHTPEPQDGLANMVAGDVTLSWIAGKDPNNVDYTDFYVYLGTSEDNMELLNTSVIHDTEYAIGSTQYDTTYYWQVEEVEQMNGVLVDREAGDPNNTFGPVWTFETVYFQPRVVSIAADNDKARTGEMISIDASYTTHEDYPVTGVTWYYNGTAIDVDASSDYSVVTTGTESTLSVSLNAATFGSYYCIAENAYGSSYPSDEIVFTAQPAWSWTGASGTTSWSDSGNWDNELAPTLDDDVLISGGSEGTPAVVDFDLDEHFYQTNYVTLDGYAELVIPAGIRYAGGSGESTTLNVKGNSALTVGESNYFIVSMNTPSVINQTGGEVNATIDRGFFFSDAAGGKGEYNLTGGTLNVDFTQTSNSDGWYQMMGRGTGEPDVFTIDGGDAVFTNSGNSGRRIYMLRNSLMTINSGSASFSDMEKMSVGRTESGIASVVVNGGEFDLNDTSLYVGDMAIGKLEINGGSVNVTAAAEEDKGIMIAYASGCQGTVSQSGGVLAIDGAKVLLGSSSSSDLSSAKYVISGGSIESNGLLELNANSEFNISGSAASAIMFQEIDVNDASATLAVDLDATGCSMITVGSDAEDATLTAGAQLAGMTIEVNTLDSYAGGDTFDIIWAANNGITGADSISLVNNSNQDFEVVVADATRYGYPSGELLQLRVVFDPSRADFNADNTVDVNDFARFAEAWMWEKE